MIDQPKIWDTLRCIERALKAVTASTLFTYIEIQHFQKTSTLIHKLVEDENNGIINVWFSYFEPNTKLGLHVNNDPYMYRAHLGLIVPDGNIGFKVCDDIVKWKEGEILVFDPTNPHTAWNLTERLFIK